jgi:hypothetical protein
MKTSVQPLACCSDCGWNSQKAVQQTPCRICGSYFICPECGSHRIYFDYGLEPFRVKK